MSHTFTFHLSTSSRGEPRLLHIIDLLAVCPLCGYEEIQRFYHPGPLHKLTLPRYRRLLHEAAQLLNFLCSNCDTPVTPQHATQGAVTLAFADQRGLVRSFFDLHNATPHNLRHTLHPDEPLDPQALPAWTPTSSDRDSDLLRELTDDHLLEQLGRVFNLKAAWRLLLSSPRHTPRHLVASPSTILVYAPDEVSYSRYTESLNLPRHLLPFDLLTPPPPLLPLQDTRNLPGNPHLWLPQDLLQSPPPIARALLDPQEAHNILAATLEAAHLSYVYSEKDGGCFGRITTPRDALADRDLPLHTILAHAAWTALTPGEAARLSAEALVAELLGLELR